MARGRRSARGLGLGLSSLPCLRCRLRRVLRSRLDCSLNGAGLRILALQHLGLRNLLLQGLQQVDAVDLASCVPACLRRVLKSLGIGLVAVCRIGTLGVTHGVALESLWSRSWVTLESLWNHFAGLSGVAQESLWNRSGTTLESLWNRSGIALESLGGRSGIALESLWDRSGIALESL